MSDPRSIRALSLLVSAVLSLPLAGAADAKQANAPLVVDAAVSKFGATPASSLRCMTVGVPLAEGWNIQPVNGRPPLRLTGPQRWQFRTTETWPSGAIKWAVGRAIVQAGGGAPNFGVGVTLGTGVSADVNLAAVQPGGTIRVDTGALLVDVRPVGFNILDRVVVDGLELVKSGTSPGIVARDAAGNPLTVMPGTQLVVVENGPAFALVAATGTLQDATGNGVIDFTCRLAFEHGSRDVEVTFTVRNANILRPQHTPLQSIELKLKLAMGASPLARIALPAGEQQVALTGSGTAWAYQAYSSAFTEEVLGSGTNWLPPIPKPTPSTFEQEGYSVGSGGTTLFAGTKDEYPLNPWLDLSGSAGGCTVTIAHMPHFWPAALEAATGGNIAAGIFTPRNEVGYTWSWRQHESRTAVFSFHKGAATAPVEVSRRLDAPVIGRLASPLIYQVSGCLPYDLLSPQEHDLAYALLGIDHQVQVSNLYFTVTRYLPSGATGGENNHDYVERLLASEFLRFGTGGQWLTAMDLALWKSESQILRSDNFLHPDDPGASNDAIPHSKNIAADDEHRYRGGIALAWHLTGDERFRDALQDEAEILPTLDIWAQERSMYQSLVALVEVADATHAWSSLTPVIRDRLQFFCTPLLDVATGVDGFGWDGPPGQGPRGYYVYSEQNNSEKPPGENYVTRGFITSSMGPRGLWRAARYLGEQDPDAQLALRRLVDLARYTQVELYPWQPVAADRHLVYSYSVKLELVNSWEETDFHPILLGMAEAWLQTGDLSFLIKGLEQLEAFEAHGNLEFMDKRLEAQHFLRAVLDLAEALGVI